jgi:hypothetical protein
MTNQVVAERIIGMEWINAVIVMGTLFFLRDVLGLSILPLVLYVYPSHPTKPFPPKWSSSILHTVLVYVGCGFASSSFL